MEQSENLKNFEKEYSLETKLCEITENDLYEAGLTSSDLASEAFLRRIYGDESLIKNEEEDSVVGEKSVQKINEDDITLSKSLTNEFAEIEADEFITALDTILLKAKR